MGTKTTIQTAAAIREAHQRQTQAAYERVVAEIATLKGELKALQALERELSKQLGASAATVAADSGSELPERFAGMSGPERILTVLADDPDRWMTKAEIAEAAHLSSLNVANTTLKRLRENEAQRLDYDPDTDMYRATQLRQIP